MVAATASRVTRFYLILTLVGCLFLFNCVTYTSYNPDFKVVEFTDSSSNTKVIVLNLKYQAFINDNLRIDSYKVEDHKKEQFKSFLDSSLLFKEVKKGLETGDYKLQISLEERVYNNVILLVLTFCTLGVIPSYEIQDVSIQYRFKDNKDKLLKEYNREVNFYSLVHLSLAPIALLLFPGYEKGMGKITKSVLAEAIRDGVFK